MHHVAKMDNHMSVFTGQHVDQVIRDTRQDLIETQLLSSKNFVSQ